MNELRHRRNVCPGIRLHYSLCFLALFCLFRSVLNFRGVSTGSIFLFQVGKKLLVWDAIRAKIPWHIANAMFGFVSGMGVWVLPITLGYALYRVSYPAILRVHHLLMAFLLVVLLSAVSMGEVYYRNLGKVVTELYARKMLGIELSAKERGKLSTLVMKTRLDSGAYVFQQGRWRKSILGTMEGTSAGFLVNYLISGEVDHAALGWILSRERHDGGFSPVGAVSPELESTLCAIKAVHAAGSMGLIQHPDEHVRFVLDHVSPHGGFIPTGMKKPNIDAAYGVIAVLSMLGKSHVVIRDREKCAEWIFRQWQRTDSGCKLNFQETYYLVYCLK
jgi:hypothetical protein